MENEQVIREYFSGWNKKDWGTVEETLAEGFSFNSPVDDHIDKQAYREKCWPLSEAVESIEINKIIESGPEAFARYEWKTSDGKVGRCVEFFRIEKGKIKEVDVYWGFPSQGV